ASEPLSRVGGGARGRRRAPEARYELSCTTLVACGPLSPGASSNSTFAPSDSDLKPSPEIDVWWTKRSLSDPSGEMNPYPFESLNHFTVPVAIKTPPLPLDERVVGRRVADQYALVSSASVA